MLCRYTLHLGNLRLSVQAQALQPTAHKCSLSLTVCSYSGLMITVSRRSYELFGASDSSITQLTLTRPAAGFLGIILAPSLANFAYLQRRCQPLTRPCRSPCSVVCLEFPKAAYSPVAMVHPPYVHFSSIVRSLHWLSNNHTQVPCLHTFVCCRCATYDEKTYR